MEVLCLVLGTLILLSISEHVAIHNFISGFYNLINFTRNLLFDISLRLLLTGHHVEEVRSFFTRITVLSRLGSAARPILTELAVSEVTLV